jgi:Subtilisin-like serine proteases
MLFHRTIIAAGIALLLLSCSKEAVEIVSDADEDVPVAASAEDMDADGFVSGISVVRFSEEMIGLIESDLDEGKVVTRSMGLNQALDELGITSIRRIFPDGGEYEPRRRRHGLHRWYEVRFDASLPQTRASAELNSIPGVEYVEGRMPVESCGFNDPKLSSQWGLNNLSHPGIDINVRDVWNNYSTGNPKVKVAILDYGIYLVHEDLAWNCGKDHHDFVSGDSSIEPGAHGAHTAGIVAAVSNNGKGVCGVAGGDFAAGQKGATLMSCQVFKNVLSSDGKIRTLSGGIPAAFVWAADHGALICSNSWTYSYDSDGNGKLTGAELEKAMNAQVSMVDKVAIDYFIENAGCDVSGNQLPESPMKGGLVVFSAGNNGIANGAPSNYEKVVAVGAVTSDGSKASYSNYGSWVDICAPGSEIMSTTLSDGYGLKSGTSMACPFVSGAAALVVSVCGGPGFTCERLREKLVGSARKYSAVADIGGLLDVCAAVRHGETIVSEKVVDVSVSARLNNLILSWPVVKDNLGGRVSSYRVLCGTDREAVENCDPASPPETGIRVEDVKVSSGLEAGCTVSELEFGKEYFVKIAGLSLSGYGDPSDVCSQEIAQNEAPVLVPSSVEPLVFEPMDSYTLPVSASDPEGHEMTYSYTSGSAADSFTESANGRRFVRIDASKASFGSYTGVLVVSDCYGASSALEVSYTIRRNLPPAVLKVGEDILLPAGSGSVALDLDEYFHDPEEEAMRFVLAAGTPGVVDLVQDGPVVSVRAAGEGRTQVWVTAFDAKGQSAEISFRVVVRKASVQCVAYPNPVGRVLSIASGEKLEDVSVSFTSLSGAKVMIGNTKASAFDPGTVDVSSLAPGRYKATIRFGSVEFEQTIVKK